MNLLATMSNRTPTLKKYSVFMQSFFASASPRIVADLHISRTFWLFQTSNYISLLESRVSKTNSAKGKRSRRTGATILLKWKLGILKIAVHARSFTSQKIDQTWQRQRSRSRLWPWHTPRDFSHPSRGGKRELFCHDSAFKLV